MIADGLLYAVSDEGVVYTVKCGKAFEVIAENKLNDICMVTPAITEGIIFFRTQERLVAVGKK